jgi:hypothetical protein
MRPDLWDDPVEVVEKPNWSQRALDQRMELRQAMGLIGPPPKLEFDESLSKNEGDRGMSLEEKDAQRKKLEAIHDKLFEDAASVCSDLLKFGDLEEEIGPDGVARMKVPEDWFDELQDLTRVNKRKRLAQYALMNNKYAPVGTKIAPAILAGMLKAQAGKNDVAPRTLNVAIIQMAVDMPRFPEKIISSE